MSLTLILEKRFWNQGKKVVVGADEVGRGSLAGPVVAAAVSFPSNHKPIIGVNDSKRLTSQKRTALNVLIREQAWRCKVISVSAAKVNSLGITAATQLALSTCLNVFENADMALIDGVWAPQLKFPCRAIVRGDATCYSIAAASIVAKVFRDSLMKRLSRQYPQYGWDKNMGYGTFVHRTMIIRHGPSIYHRSLFIRKTLSTQSSSNN